MDQPISSHLYHIPRENEADGSSSLVTALLRGLRVPTGQKHLPVIILYSEKGLQLYDDLTTHAGHHYYLFPAEEAILKQHSANIVRVMCRADQDEEGVHPTGEEKNIPKHVLLELGAGSLRKTAHIIQALASEGKGGPRYTYYALDLEPQSIAQSLKSLAPLTNGSVELRGLVADYETGLQWVRSGGSEHDQDNLDSQSFDRGRTSFHLRHEGQFPASPPPSASSLYSSGSGKTLMECAGLRTATSTKAVLPEEGRRLPDHVYPLTPPMSRDLSEVRGNDTDTCNVKPRSSKEGSDITGRPPLHLMFLGSSLGNFDRVESTKFLSSFPLIPGSSDTLLLGLDGRNDKALIERAYNDPEGYTAKFILGGLDVLQETLDAEPDGGGSLIDRFEYVGRYNVELGRHEAYYQAKATFSTTVNSERNPSGREIVSFEKGEEVHIEYSYKYSDMDAYKLFQQSKLRPIARWQDPRKRYTLWLLERPAYFFPLRLQSDPCVSPSTVPTLDNFRELWKVWDMITLKMIPKTMLHEKPIDLRHKCLFYLGHIPVFLDIHLSKLLSESPTEPEYFKNIFERGIDPCVDEPSQIHHSHSAVPDALENWPLLESILEFRNCVRLRLENLYTALERADEKVTKLGRKVDRVLWMTYEHEAWHAETLLYMLIQRAGIEDGTIPPSGISRPLWALSPPIATNQLELLRSGPSFETTITLYPQAFTIGHDDFERDDISQPIGTNHEFGWDNEHPRREVCIEKAIRVEKWCISNAEYAQFFREKGNLLPPTSWVIEGEEIKVRTLYGPVPLHIAANWPLVSSYDDLAAYAAWKGGRIPNEIELRAFMDLHLGAVTSNIGFKEWSFIEPEDPDPIHGTRGHNGGAWEWTSTVLASCPGYVPSVIYPGYSSDFFDECHNVVLGGSWATIPGIAQRRTVRNFYQHNYRYAWVGARVVYDLDQ